MRSHLTAFGVGAGLSLLAAGAFALIAPKIARGVDDGDGVHIVNIGNGENGSFHLKDEALNISADWKGDFEFAADGRSLSTLKGSLEVEEKREGISRKAIFSRKDGEISAKSYVGGELVAADAESDKIAGDLLQLFSRTSSVGSEGRVKALMAAGGKKAVIDEIGELVGSHAVGGYIEALAAASSLSREDISQLAARIQSVSSDYAKRSAISALLTTQNLDDASIADILGVAKTIEGDHELRLIVDEIAEKPLSDRNFGVAASLIENIEGDHEIRLAISALLETDGQNDADIARILDIAATSIDGDYELRLAIEAAGERVKGEKAGAAAVQAVAAIEGAHDRRLAIEAVAGALDGASPHWIALIETASGVDGDHERRLAIEAIKSVAPESDDIRAALQKAVTSISSDHERRLALEALE